MFLEGAIQTLPFGFPCEGVMEYWRLTARSFSETIAIPGNVQTLINGLRGTDYTRGLTWPSSEVVGATSVGRLSAADNAVATVLPNGKKGLSLGTVVFVRDDYFDELEHFPSVTVDALYCGWAGLRELQREALKTLVHELVHSEQYRRAGQDMFCADAALEAVGLVGDSDQEAEAANAEGFALRFDPAGCPDGDTIPEPVDNCPYFRCKNAPAFATWVHCDNPDQADSDRDGVGDACDICPYRYNPYQEDRDLDGDGRPDACEADYECPCDPVTYPRDHDNVCGYCDGRLGAFCAEYCGSSSLRQIDNCPTVDNDDQLNCNAEVERVRNAAVMGDKCDPVPCPFFTPVYDEQIPSMVFNEDWYALSSIRLAPIGSHRSKGKPKGNTSPPEEAKVFAKTDYRACVDVPPEVICSRDVYVENSFLTRTKNVAEERRDSVWHRVSIEGLTEPGTAPDASDWDPLDDVLYQTGWQKDLRWNWRDDYLRWSQGWGSGVVQAPSIWPNQPARFWAHGRTNVGESVELLDFGLHPILDESHTGMDASDHSRLVNHYEIVPMVARVVTGSPPRRSPAFLARFCPDCPMGILRTGEERINPGALRRIGGDSSPYETQVLFAVPAKAGAEVGVLRQDGQLELVTTKLSASLRETLVSDALLLNAVEPFTSVGRGSARPVAVALSPDGTVILDQVLQGAGEFISAKDREVVDGGLHESAMSRVAADLEGPALSGAVMASLDAPLPRKDFQAVYSRAAGRVFLVGGSDASTGRLTGEIWSRDVEIADWQLTPLAGYAPERVMAATWSYRDKNLWVLDQLGSGSRAMARLARIDPQSGVHQVVGVWPRSRFGNGYWLFDKHWLVLDRDGNVLLAASSASMNEHVIVRLEVGGDTPTVDGVRVELGSFAAAPAVDADGYSLVLDDQNTPRLERTTSLGARPGRWQDLGSCL